MIGLCTLFVNTLWPDEAFSIVGLEMSANLMIVGAYIRARVREREDATLLGMNVVEYAWHDNCFPENVIYTIVLYNCMYMLVIVLVMLQTAG